MQRLIPDASVAVKWFLPEPGTDRADLVIACGKPLLAPELLYVEVANVLTVRQRCGDLTVDEVLRAMERLHTTIILPFSVRDLAAGGARIAIETGRTAYDCLYVALAVQESALLITADAKLLRGLQGTSYERQVCDLSEDRWER